MQDWPPGMGRIACPRTGAVLAWAKDYTLNATMVGKTVVLQTYPLSLVWELGFVLFSVMRKLLDHLFFSLFSVSEHRQGPYKFSAYGNIPSFTLTKAS